MHDTQMLPIAALQHSRTRRAEVVSSIQPQARPIMLRAPVLENSQCRPQPQALAYTPWCCSHCRCNPPGTGKSPACESKGGRVRGGMGFSLHDCRKTKASAIKAKTSCHSCHSTLYIPLDISNAQVFTPRLPWPCAALPRSDRFQQLGVEEG